MAKKASGAAQRIFEKLGAAGTSAHVFTGMIKPADDDKETIMYARAGDCSKWIKIPADHVADIQLIHIVHCEGHTHPLVHLFMKEPDSPHAKTFAALAGLHQAPPKMLGQPGSTPCYWDWVHNRWVCPPS